MSAAPTTQGVVTGHQFNQDGFQLFPGFVSSIPCALMAEELTLLFEEEQQSLKNRIGGLRNLFHRCPAVARMAHSAPFISLLKQVTNREMFPVRAIFFDKTPDANWRVPWHQDLTIAVAGRIETPGFDGWSLKEEIPHVQPPVKILQNMATLRLHLDDCDAGNGALKVIPGSHCHGKLAGPETSRWVESHPAVVCEMARGGVMLMRPLLLHASSPATRPLHRRVLHLEYAAEELPNGLKWFDC